MKRRTFINSTLGTLVVGLYPAAAIPKTGRSITPLTVPSIAELFVARFPATRDRILNGRNWANDQLEGNTIFRPLAVEYQGKYEVKQLTTPCTWTENDQAKNPTLAQRISLVDLMSECLIHSHDDLLAKQLKGGQLVVSTTYHHRIGDVSTIDNQAAWYVMLSTAYARIPHLKV